MMANGMCVSRLRRLQEPSLRLTTGSLGLLFALGLLFSTHRSQATLLGAEALVFGPETYTGTGRPVRRTSTFNVQTGGSGYILRVTNNGVRFGLVVLNGRIVLRPSDFNDPPQHTGRDDDPWEPEWERAQRDWRPDRDDRTIGTIEKPVTLLPGRNEIIVAFISRPGTSFTLEIALTSGAPNANPGGPYVGNVGQAITFNGSQSTAPAGQTITSYTWSFGDSSTGTGATPSHAYASVGTYQVSLRVTDTLGGTNVASTTATVAALPVANPGGPYRGTATQPVSFNGTGSTAPAGQTITSYAWNFGDSSTGTGSTPTHTYASPGTFQISLTVTDTTGGRNSATTTATIASAASSIVGFTPTSGTIGTVVNVTLTNFTPAAGASPRVTLVGASGVPISAPVSSVAVNALSFVVPAGAGSGAITITSGGQTAVSSGSFTVTTSSSFTLTVGPATASLIPGQQVTYAITLASSNGFNGLATLAVTGVPSGVTTGFKPTAMTPGQTAVLTLSAPLNQALGSASLSVSAAATVDGQTVSQSATASLQITGVSTSFVGRTVVDDAQQTPIAGVSISFLGKDDKGNITGCSAQTVSDAGGNFALTQLPQACTGPQLISYNGLTATSPPGTYAGVNLSYTLAAGQVTTSPVLIHLPRIDNAQTVGIQQKAATTQVLTFTSLPTVRVTVYPGTTFTLQDGSTPNPFPLVAVQVPVDRLPDAMATSGMVMPFIVAFQPANAYSSQPVAVDFPNSLNMPPGGTASLMTLDPTRGYMVPYGTGTATSDGTRIMPDPDPNYPGHAYGLIHFDWHGPAAMPPPTVNPSPTCGCTPGATDCCLTGFGGPIDASSGVDVIKAIDIAINGPRGSISIERTQRTLSTNPGPFGMGTNHNYGYQLNTIAFLQGQGVITLVMPDGNQFPFSVQQGGAFVNSTIPTMRGAVLRANSSTGSYSLQWKDGTVYQFQAPSAGPRVAYLTSITDTNGNATTLTLNPSVPGQVMQVTDPVGRSLLLNYDGADRITSITDPIGRSAGYTYNSQSQLATVTDLVGGITSYFYDNQGHLSSVKDPRGIITEQNTYDSNGRVVQQIQPDGGVLQFAYTLLNPAVAASSVLQTVVTDPLKNQTTYRFDPTQLLTAVSDSTGQVKTFALDPEHSNLVMAISGRATCSSCGDSTSGNIAFTLDQNGNILASTDELGNTTTFTYSQTFNRVTSISEPLGHVTQSTYDSAGNLLTRTDPDGKTMSFTHNAFGQVTQTTDPVGQKTAFSYDDFGNLITVTDPLGDATSTVYDGVSRPIQTIDALGRKSSTTYDALSRVISQTDAQGNTTQFLYDAAGNVLSVTDAKGNKTSFTYDGVNRLLTRTDPLGHADTRTYDTNGNLVQFVDRRARIGSFAYDPLNRLVGETYTDATVARSYDANGRLLHVTDSQGGSFEFTYDAVDHLLSSSNPFGTVQFSYDKAGRTNSRQVAGQSTLAYSYDPADNLLSTSMPQASANFGYDADNRLVSITRGNGVNSQYVYDPASRLLSISDSGGQGVSNSEVYAYDSVGNRFVQASNAAQPLITQGAANTFDNANRLLTSGETSYSYDANGNLTSAVNPAGSRPTRGTVETVYSPSRRLAKPRPLPMILTAR